MIYALAFNFSVNLIFGTALCMIWVRAKNLNLTRLLGASFIAQSLGVPLYLLWLQPVYREAAIVGLALAATAVFICLFAGLSELAHRAVRPIVLLLQSILLCSTIWLALRYGGATTSQMITASLNFLIGCGALVLLWKESVAGRIVGGCLILMGLVQYLFVFGGDELLPVQATVGAALRMVLGITLLYAAVQLADSETSRLRKQVNNLTEHSLQGVCVTQGGQTVYANRTLLRLLGKPELAVDFDDPMSASDELLTLPPPAALEGLRSWQAERRGDDGLTRVLQFSAWAVDWNGKPATQVVVIDDTARSQAVAALLHRATHHPLTGLPSRGVLDQTLLERCTKREGFVLCCIDVDRFTMINETYGHDAGDQVLCRIAKMLESVVLAQGMALHLGEDEFALVIDTGDSREGADRLLSATQQLLSQPLRIGDLSIYVDLSVGAASFPGNGRTPDALQRSATGALHSAKATPGFATRWSGAGTVHRSFGMLAEQAMRTALQQDQFHLHYQPKLSAGDHRLTGFEALVRWFQPGSGMISPAEFIPAAERTGLIVPLGELLLFQACRQIRNWLAAGLEAVPVAVNVSALQLQDHDFPDTVLRAVQAASIPPCLLSLEITETVAVHDLEQSIDRLSRLRAFGISVSLDDFGAGFSSLSVLRSLPLAAVKIDRSLIDPLPDANALAVVGAICQLSRVLQLKVVAEGVETAEQASSAAAAGCDELQGFLLGRPVAADAASAWLSRSQAALHPQRMGSSA